MRLVRTLVLPEPAPARMTSDDASDVTASRCASFNPSRSASAAIAATLPTTCDSGDVIEVDVGRFEELVADALDGIPGQIGRLIDNVAVFVEDIGLSNNILGTGNLFEAVRIAKLDPLIQLCSTSEVYGQVQPHEVPIREEQPMRPASPYAVSKVAQDLLGYTYFVAYKMRIIRTRMFAYLNPRRTDLFATSFARQVARIEVGLQKELTHGNLESVRTIVDVRDAMRAYWEALLHCKAGEAYNIGGTATMTVGEFTSRRVCAMRSLVAT